MKGTFQIVVLMPKWNNPPVNGETAKLMLLFLVLFDALQEEGFDERCASLCILYMSSDPKDPH